MLFHALCLSACGFEVGRHGASDSGLNPGLNPELKIMLVESVRLAASLRTPDAASP
jgi:hypothetical protein